MGNETSNNWQSDVKHFDIKVQRLHCQTESVIGSTHVNQKQTAAEDTVQQAQTVFDALDHISIPF